MTWVAYRKDGHEHVGIVDGDRYVPLKGIRRIDAATGSAELRQAEPDPDGAVHAVDVELLPPSWAPEKVFCVGLNYDEHIRETGRDLPTYPVLFPKYASSLIAADRPIPVPAESSQVDYEAEVAVVIGKAGRRIPRERAMEHVLGYTVANDVTMRDYQYKTHQWLQGKAWDGATPIGPFLVPHEEVDLPACRIRTVVDGVTVQDSELSVLIFDVPTLIATISEFTALAPGDIILTGTPGGVGFRRDPQLFLTPGSTVTVEVDGIGRIESPVIAE
ncbi:fumarylacetoacetate hydrolase family protein [Microbacterium sp.]|uniref:fumarylacetoacetate hydrolase family protein n=1 Tax=Microbacterium sp. TaxID=51671 RepID=UPI0039E2F12C